MVAQRRDHGARAKRLLLLLRRLIEVIIGSVMVISAWLHLQNEMVFYAHVARYKLAPPWLLPFVVLTIPWALLFSGMLIITRSGRPVGHFAGAVLFAIFAIAQVHALWAGYDIDCGCLAFLIEKRIGRTTVVTTVALCVACAALALPFHDRQPVEKPSR